MSSTLLLLLKYLDVALHQFSLLLFPTPLADHLYANLFHRWTPAIQSVVGARGVTFALTFIDQAIHHPIMYFPCFYLLRGSIAGEAPMDSLMQYKVCARGGGAGVRAVLV